MSTPRTKFRPPGLRQPIVPRPRLTKSFIDRQPLTIVSAPAGSGKTTLALEWLASSKSNTAWFSLDSDDNDPIRFINGFITALQSAGKKLRVPSGQRDLKTILADIINQLDGGDPVTFVLDDYHMVQEDSIHKGMEYLLDHIPGALQLVIVTRTSPPLPLARLRARGQLREFHLEDLCFTTEETGQFLNRIMGLNLSGNQIQSLMDHSQGWVAGLQMAGLSLQSNPDVTIPNDHARQFLVDYFLNEVFNHQPREVQSFLLNTSIAERFSAELCKSLHKRGTSRILAYLERSNMFISMVGGSYQYHPLFRDFLLEKLTVTHPDRVPDLHRTVLRWLKKRNFKSEAIHHAFAIPDYATAARLIAELAPDALKRGELITLRRWLGQLPEAVIWRYPRLCVTQIWLFLDSGQQQDAQAYIDRLGSHLEKDLRSEFLILRALLAAMEHHPDMAMNYVQMAQKTKGAKDPFMQTYLSFGLGAAQKMASRFFDSEQSFRNSLAYAETDGNSFIALSAYTNLIDVLYLQARLKDAASVCMEALQKFDVNRAEAGDWYFTLARIAFQRNQLEDALEFINDSIDRSTDSSQVMILARSLLQRAQIHHGLGADDKAQSDLDSADLAARSLQDTNILHLILRQRVLLAIRSGDIQAARQWFTLLETHGDTPYTYYQSYTKGRLLVAEENVREAQVEFDTTLKLLDERGGPVLIRIDALIWNGACLGRLNRKSEAKICLQSAVKLAQPGGLIHPFVEAREAIADLLREAGSNKFVRSVENAHRNGSPNRGETGRVDPGRTLTKREREILQLLTVGMTNQEMAERLFIAEGTLKRHIANLYQKLGVHNRTQAIRHNKEPG